MMMMAGRRRRRESKKNGATIIKIIYIGIFFLFEYECHEHGHARTYTHYIFIYVYFLISSIKIFDNDDNTSSEAGDQCATTAWRPDSGAAEVGGGVISV